MNPGWWQNVNSEAISDSDQWFGINGPILLPISVIEIWNGKHVSPMTSVTCPARLFLLAAINQEGPDFLWEMYAHDSLVSWNLTASTIIHLFSSYSYEHLETDRHKSQANQRPIKSWRGGSGDGPARNATTQHGQRKRGAGQCTYCACRA